MRPDSPKLFGPPIHARARARKTMHNHHHGGIQPPPETHNGAGEACTRRACACGVLAESLLGPCSKGGPKLRTGRHSQRVRREVVSRVLQGEAWAAGGDQGRFRMARGPRCVHATGARAYHALIKVVVEIVDAASSVATAPGTCFFAAASALSARFPTPRTSSSWMRGRP